MTSRAAVLVLVLALLAVSYASSMRAYLEQRHEIDDLNASIATSQADIAAMTRERQRWRDPAFVISQARARFAFGFPGEIGFRVLDSNGKPLDPESSLSDRRPTLAKPQWWQTTLSSIDSAGYPPKPGSGPAVRITPQSKSAG